MPDEILRRSLEVSSVDAENRTVEIVFATETPVSRRTWEDGPYQEILVVTREAIIRDRLDAGMSLLDSHRAHSVDSILGTVVPKSLRFEGRKALATVRISKKQRAQELLDDLADGHRLSVSVGYRIAQEERTEGIGDAVPTVRATRWEPMEISVVPIPADPNAHTRNHEGQMADNDTIERGAEPQTTSRKLGIRERRTFVNGLLQPDFLKRHPDEVEELISDTRGMTEDQVRAEVHGLRVDIQDRSPTFPHTETRGMSGSRMTRAQAMSEALLHRADPSRKISDDSREFVGRTIPELARSCIEARGGSTIGENAGTLVMRALHTTSDFPALLVNTSNTILAASYAAVPSPLKKLGTRTIAPDFNKLSFLRLADMPELKKLNEHGEYTSGTLGEATEGYKIETYGRIFGVTRQLLINDNVGAIMRAVSQWGRSAQRLEAKLLCSLLVSNPIMGDGTPLFHANHGNLGTASALDIANLKKAVTHMRKQVDMSGEYIGVSPRYLIVGADLEFDAQTLLAATTPSNTGDVNPLAGQLELIVEPRLPATAPKEWYLAASPAEVEGLDYAYLSGNETPFFDEHVEFGIDGVQFKLRHDFGAGFTDWRGWYKNPGLA